MKMYTYIENMNGMASSRAEDIGIAAVRMLAELCADRLLESLSLDIRLSRQFI